MITIMIKKEINRLNKERKKLLISLIKLIISLMLYLFSIYLSIIWFGWELLVILSLFQTANNIQINEKIENKLKKYINEI